LFYEGLVGFDLFLLCLDINFAFLTGSSSLYRGKRLKANLQKLEQSFFLDIDLRRCLLSLRASGPRLSMLPLQHYKQAY
jgi:hypothetical protein